MLIGRTPAGLSKSPTIESLIAKDKNSMGELYLNIMARLTSQKTNFEE